MTSRPDPLEERFENLLREQVSSRTTDAMSGLVRDLRREYANPLPMEIQNRQIAEMVAAGREAAAHPSPLWRRRIDEVWFRFSRRFIAGSVVGKVLLAASVATAATTGMAATGHLPDPLLIAISAAASHVGVSIPTPAPASVDPSPTPSPTPERRAPAVAAPAAGPVVSAPAPPPGGTQVQPVPSPTPANPCDSTILATPQPPNADLLEAVKKLTEDQRGLEKLLNCLVPTQPSPPQPGGAAAPASTDALAKLLNDLMGVNGP